jgi:hypothetical protein
MLPVALRIHTQVLAALTAAIARRRSRQHRP